MYYRGRRQRHDCSKNKMRKARIDINTSCYGILLREINSDFTVRESCLEELEYRTTGALWVQTTNGDLPGELGA